MSQSFQVSVGDMGTFRARRGETLLDAALINGVDIPHDCRSGHCGSCRCKVESGTVEGGETDAAGTVLACQARVVSDLDISIEDTPPIETFAGKVQAIQSLSKDVMEVTIKTKQPLDYLPGQYVQVKFAGFPARCYSPTLPLGGPADRGTIRLQVKRVRNGLVSTALGEAIAPGHKVKIVGPFGSAYLRPGLSNRLVLVAGGAGFAPIWSIAHAALCEMPDREIFMIVGANRGTEFYMAQALLRLITFPKTKVLAVVREVDRPHSTFPVGSPLAYLPTLSPEDIVYACGAPRLVEGVAATARASGASCYVDPFVPAATQGNAMDWAQGMLAAASPLNLLRWFDGGGEVANVR